ncbi:YbbR-like domain-containing protein [candidate division CSSED10-310 bacterium]|uniref:YbbR-like domain-containing protein n=1 Tax=candidate division CSSED10-310 bacterium TaxID=2855610 RepID=A0ABV6YRG5_UNCC1
MNTIKRYLKRFVVENFYLKAGSFVLAIMLWLIVQYQGQIEEKVDLGIDINVFNNLPLNEMVHLYKQSAQSVTVKMRGLPSAMSKIQKQVNVSISLPEDFSDWGKEVPFDLMQNNIQHPLGVEILNITPSTVTVILDFFAENQVEVVKNYGGIPPPGYQVENVTVTPEKVKIFGPRSFIEHKSQILTERIDISKMTMPNAIDAKLYLPHPQVSCLPQKVVMNVIIVEIIQERLFENLTMKIKNLPGTQAKIDPDKVSVTITGPQNIVRELNESLITVILDVQELPLDKWREVAPKVEFHPKYSRGLESKNFKPEKIKVKILKSSAPVDKS